MWAWYTKKNLPKSPSEILHNHLTVLVRYKKPKCVFRTTQAFSARCYEIPKKIRFLANFLMPHCLMRSLKHSGKGKQATATALFLWWKRFKFCGKKKTFTILNAYDVLLFYLSSFIMAIAHWYSFHQSTHTPHNHFVQTYCVILHQSTRDI